MATKIGVLKRSRLRAVCGQSATGPLPPDPVARSKLKTCRLSPIAPRCRWLKLALAAVAGSGVATLWLVDPRVGRLWLNTAWLAAGGMPDRAAARHARWPSLLFKTDVPGRGPAAWLLVGMLFVPLYLVTGAWDAGFGIQGWHTLVTNPHLAHEPWLAGWRAAIWVHGLAAVPWVVLIVGAGLRAVEAEIEEDAATCATPLQVLWHVSLRRAAPAIVVAALWIVTIVMAEISVTDFFQVRTFAEEVYTQSALGTFDAVGRIDRCPSHRSTFPPSVCGADSCFRPSLRSR